MSEWPMWGHFRHLSFNTFPTIWRTPQGKVFWPLKSSSEFLGVPEGSQVPILGVWVATSHFPQSGVTTLPGGWHPAKSLRKAGVADAWLAFFLSLLIASPNKEGLGAKKASQGPYVGRSEDLLAMIEIPLLVKGGARAPPPLLRFSLLPLSLPKPCFASHPASRILSTTRKNSLSLASCWASKSE